MAENKVTFSFLEGIPARERIKQRLTKLWNYERFSVPRKRGGRYFYERNSGLQNQRVLYVTDALRRRAAQLLFNPNALAADGTVALAGYSVSEDGALMAYGLFARWGPTGRSGAFATWRQARIVTICLSG